MKYLLALLSVFLAIPIADAAWGTGGCAAVAAPAVQTWEWQYEGVGPTAKGHLYRRGVYVGTWDYGMRRWRPAVTGTAAPFKMPTACSDGCCCESCGGGCSCTNGSCGDPGCTCVARLIEQAPTQNFGIDTDMLSHPKDGKTVYRHNGREISKDAAYEAVGGRIPDDTGKLWLTIIGTAEQTKPVLDGIANKAFDGLREKLIVKSFLPSHWAVAKAGFVTSGRPTIYLQAPDGKVLHRQDDYDGAEPFAGAVRKANDAYESKKDPDMRKPINFPNIPLGPIVGIAVCVGVIILLRKV